MSLIVFSIGVFADEVFYDKIKKTAIRHNSEAYIASGVAGRFDVLRTISLIGQAKPGIRTEKGPASLTNTPLYGDDLMTEEREPHVFSGNAKEAISILPTKVNVAIAVSLATAGPEDTNVSILGVPGMMGDDHKITMEIGGIKATVDIYSSTNAIAGWSMVAVLKNLVSPIVFQDAPL